MNSRAAPNRPAPEPAPEPYTPKPVVRLADTLVPTDYIVVLSPKRCANCGHEWTDSKVNLVSRIEGAPGVSAHLRHVTPGTGYSLNEFIPIGYSQLPVRQEFFCSECVVAISGEPLPPKRDFRPNYLHRVEAAKAAPSPRVAKASTPKKVFTSLDQL